MDKFELKDRLIVINDNIDNMLSKLMSRSVNDERTGNIRSEVYCILLEVEDKLQRVIENIN